MNIEAELIVKGAVQSEDQYIILDTDFIPCGLHCFAPLYGAKGSMLQVAFERIPDSVEATIFIRVIHGSWPADFRGHFAASTSVEFEILLIECKGDGKSIREDGNMKHLRHVVSVHKINILRYGSRLVMKRSLWRYHSRQSYQVEALVIFSAAPVVLGSLSPGRVFVPCVMTWCLIV